jgi:hypothetical protein
MHSHLHDPIAFLAGGSHDHMHMHAHMLVMLTVTLLDKIFRINTIFYALEPVKTSLDQLQTG